MTHDPSLKRTQLSEQETFYDLDDTNSQTMRSGGGDLAVVKVRTGRVVEDPAAEMRNEMSSLDKLLSANDEDEDETRGQGVLHTSSSSSSSSSAQKLVAKEYFIPRVSKRLFY